MTDSVEQDLAVLRQKATQVADLVFALLADAYGTGFKEGVKAAERIAQAQGRELVADLAAAKTAP